MTVSARRAGKGKKVLHSPYSILILRGTQVRRIVISPERVRELLLVSVLFLSVCGLFYSLYLEAERKKIAEASNEIRSQVAKSSQSQYKLLVLRDRTTEIQESLSRWKSLRERIQESLPKRRRGSFEVPHEAEELHQILAALQGELKQMIAAIPSRWPVKGRISSGVGIRRSPWTGETEHHAGLDIPNPIGTPVHAPGDAVVESVDGKRGTIVLNHSQEIKTHYAHLSKVLVRRGERVRKGQLIGNVGNKGKSTGPHLHYEVRVAGVAIDPRKSLLPAGPDE